jgi:hypothetical protein
MDEEWSGMMTVYKKRGEKQCLFPLLEQKQRWNTSMVAEEVDTLKGRVSFDPAMPLCSASACSQLSLSLVSS